MAKILASKLILKNNNKNKNNNIKRKRFWLGQVLMERHSKGEFHVLVKQLKLFDHEFFFKHFHMTHENLRNLLTMVTPRILNSSLRRKAIGPMETL